RRAPRPGHRLGAGGPRGARHRRLAATVARSLPAGLRDRTAAGRRESCGRRDPARRPGRGQGVRRVRLRGDLPARLAVRPPRGDGPAPRSRARAGRTTPMTLAERAGPPSGTLITEAGRDAFRASVLDWYDRAGRRFPFRG